MVAYAGSWLNLELLMNVQSKCVHMWTAQMKYYSLVN
jgi:hypothetical protein